MLLSTLNLSIPCKYVQKVRLCLSKIISHMLQLSLSFIEIVQVFVLEKFKKIFYCLVTSFGPVLKISNRIHGWAWKLDKEYFSLIWSKRVSEEFFSTLWLRRQICGALRDFVPFVQFKKREKHPLKKVNFSKVAGFKPATLLKLKLFHECFSRFLNCTNGTKSRNASQISYFQEIIG